MKEKALFVINLMIDNFDIVFHTKDNYTNCALHATIGKIGLACELGLISLEEADKLIDKIFIKYAKLEKY